MKDNAKFAFFYLLALVALVFTALSTGMIIFQVINKFVVDIFVSSGVEQGALKFAISAIIIATPIFYLISRQIYLALAKGELDKESPIRRWLTYLILFVSSVVVIGWLIGLLVGFFEGELTLKFILKALTAIIISGGVFSFYLLDIRSNDKKICKCNFKALYFWSSLLLIISVLIFGFITVESPFEARARRFDDMTLSNFNTLNWNIQEYYSKNKILPSDLNELKNNIKIDEDILKDVETNKEYDYIVKGDESYELCADFRLSTLDKTDARYKYLEAKMRHDAGYHCLEYTVSFDAYPKETGRFID